MTIIQFCIYMFTIFAAALSAVWIGHKIQEKAAKKNLRLWIFKTMMTYRGTPAAQEHVQALNVIEMAFYGNDKASKSVIGAWRDYVAHAAVDDIVARTEAWQAKRNELYFTLLHNMAASMNYNIHKGDLERTAYLPTALLSIEIEGRRVLSGLADIVDGKRALPVDTNFVGHVDTPNSPPQY